VLLEEGGEALFTEAEDLLGGWRVGQQQTRGFPPGIREDRIVRRPEAGEEAINEGGDAMLGVGLKPDSPSDGCGRPA
jgi:hypothetical protein